MMVVYFALRSARPVVPAGSAAHPGRGLSI